MKSADARESSSVPTLIAYPGSTSLTGVFCTSLRQHVHRHLTELAVECLPANLGHDHPGSGTGGLEDLEARRRSDRLCAHHLPMNCIENGKPANNLALRRTPKDVLGEQFVVYVGLTGVVPALQSV